MIIALSLLVCIIGLVMYLVCGNPPSPPNGPGSKAAMVGFAMFCCGLLAFLLTGAEKLLTLIGNH